MGRGVKWKLRSRSEFSPNILPKDRQKDRQRTDRTNRRTDRRQKEGHIEDRQDRWKQTEQAEIHTQTLIMQLNTKI